MPNVVGFQDASGGKGIAETEWMLPETELFGYAGGINPENMVSVVRELNAICETDFWIDMETSIRSNGSFAFFGCSGMRSVTLPEDVITSHTWSGSWATA